MIIMAMMAVSERWKWWWQLRYDEYDDDKYDADDVVE